jgi:hypothetical protein
MDVAMWAAVAAGQVADLDPDSHLAILLHERGPIAAPIDDDRRSGWSVIGGGKRLGARSVSLSSDSGSPTKHLNSGPRTSVRSC